MVGSLDQLAGVPCTTNLVNADNIATGATQTGRTALETFYDPNNGSGAGSASTTCVVADKFEPNDVKAAAVVLADNTVAATISPAGNDDWFQFPTANYSNGVGVLLDDHTTHPSRMDVYVDGALVHGATTCYFAPTIGMHTVIVRVFDSAVTDYFVGTHDYSSSPC